MKTAGKILLCILGGVMTVALTFLGSFIYVTKYKVTAVDSSVSPDGTYELALQAVGEPQWPFGPTPGRLILKKDRKTICKMDFKLLDDGAMLSPESWDVTWETSYINVVLQGSEQPPEQIRLSLDGKKETAVLKP